ncbi:hypothetical protein [Nocardioides sp. B-3]|uniref:hypothetical protein n=1 Tax=Nocardioides sp. B-3 TaxID=2895565 RepID=UPI0021524319|nr:hypothetical protein [Nocardioides sp. B-3]UUZ58815.1 hypothetical protein LP418_22435 [Nocardioides sp. B-3]
MPNDSGQPDLIATAARGGGEVRYAGAVDSDAGAADPDEAMAWTADGELYSVPTYAVDGLTVLGTFAMSGRAGGRTRHEAGRRIRAGRRRAGC